MARYPPILRQCRGNLWLARVPRPGRLRHGWPRPPIEVITEIPLPRQGGNSNARGRRRRRPYDDMAVTIINEETLPPALAFRAAGNEALFGSETRHRPPRAGEGVVVKASPRAAPKAVDRPRDHNQRGVARDPDATFLTSLDANRPTDDDSFCVEAPRAVEPTFSIADDPGELSARALQKQPDPIIRSDPTKLRSVLAALRHALRHPVTSSLDAVCEGQAGYNTDTVAATNGGASRPTAAARARQLPRRPYQLLKSKREASAEGWGGSLPPRSAGLAKLDEMLTSMSLATNRMDLERQASEWEAEASGAVPSRLSSIIRAVNAVLDETEY